MWVGPRVQTFGWRSTPERGRLGSMGRSHDDHAAGSGEAGHPIFAALYDALGVFMERGWMGERRARLLAGTHGAVLEVGGGTGANLTYYRDADRVTVVEPDPHMRKKLRPKAVTASVPVEVSAAGAEALPFPDASFDTVVSTLVLCTVPDQALALAEIRRVLRPGGRLLFVEHVRAAGPWARWQDRIEPLWGRLLGGCHPNRDTVSGIEEAGFEIEALDAFYPPVLMSRLTPHVQGSATISRMPSAESGMLGYGADE